MTGRTLPGEPEAAGRLVELLAEQSPRYAGRTSNEAERLRGELLASFETAGLPTEAIPFMLEELETGRNPSTVAAAGRALRGAATIPAEAPELLVAAIARLRGSDDVVSFAPFAPGVADAHGATALAELAATLAVLGPGAKHAIPAVQALLEGEGFSTAVRAELALALDALRGTEAPAGCCGAEESTEMDPPGLDAAPAPAIRTELGELSLIHI